MKKALTDKYVDLCTKLGDIEYKLLILQGEKKELVSQIKGLNQLSVIVAEHAQQEIKET